jgi:hypothetical protein
MNHNYFGVHRKEIPYHLAGIQELEDAPGTYLDNRHYQSIIGKTMGISFQ